MKTFLADLPEAEDLRSALRITARWQSAGWTDACPIAAGIRVVAAPWSAVARQCAGAGRIRRAGYGGRCADAPAAEHAMPPRSPQDPLSLAIARSHEM